MYIIQLRRHLKNVHLDMRYGLYFLILISSLLAIVFYQEKQMLWFYIFKPMTTVFVLFIPLVRWMKGQVESMYLKSLLIALVFCLIGDIFLMHADDLVFGLGAFLVAHLLFAFGFYRYAKGLYIFWLIVLLLFGSGMFYFMEPNLHELKIPVVIYMAVIVLMNWRSIALHLDYKKKVGVKSGYYALIPLGSLLFLISDSLIAIDKFVTAFPQSNTFILSTYWLSITLLASVYPKK